MKNVLVTNVTTRESVSIDQNRIHHRWQILESYLTGFHISSRCPQIYHTSRNHKIRKASKNPNNSQRGYYRGRSRLKRQSLDEAKVEARKILREMLNHRKIGTQAIIEVALEEATMYKYQKTLLLVELIAKTEDGDFQD